jgi:hypothetical protein
MDYFIMRQDPRVSDAARLLPNKLSVYGLTREQVSSLPTTQIFYVKESSHIEYPDIIETPGILVSEKLKRIMGKYQSNAIFKAAVLIEKKENRQEIYYIISAPEIACAAGRAGHGGIEGLVLDEGKVGDARIFRMSGYMNRVIVRLDVAESILRRDPFGVIFEKAKTAGDSKQGGQKNGG